jgi:hypothetical protein
MLYYTTTQESVSVLVEFVVPVLVVSVVAILLLEYWSTTLRKSLGVYCMIHLVESNRYRFIY